jgi:integrase
MSRYEKFQPVIVGTPAVSTTHRTAEIIELPIDAIGKQRHQQVTALAQACGSQAPNLKVRASKQYQQSVPGMKNVLDITSRSNNTTRYLRFKDPLTGNWTKKKLGILGRDSVLDMAAKAKAWQDDVADGRSPNAGSMLTDDFVSGEFTVWGTANKRSISDDLSRYALYIKAFIGHKPLGSVTTKDFEGIVQYLLVGNRAMRRGKLSNATINRAIMAGRAIFRLAKKLGYIATNPAAGVDSLKESPPSPKALEGDQIDRLAVFISAYPLLFQLLVRFILVTTARIREALDLLYSDIDYAQGVVHLRSTKAGVPETLPLTPSVIAIIAELETLRRPGNEHLFPSKNGAGPISAPYKHLRKLLAEADLERAGFHLFRKTTAVQAMMMPGMDVLTVSRMLRHKSIRTTEVHYLATPHQRLRQAANDVGELMQARLQGGGK